MAQQSIACYFNNRKRSAVDETKINRAKKVLVLDANNFKGKIEHGLDDVVTSSSLSENKQNVVIESDVFDSIENADKLQGKEIKNILPNKIVNGEKKQVNAKLIARTQVRKNKIKIQRNGNQKCIQDLFGNLNKNMGQSKEQQNSVVVTDIEREKHVMPPSTPAKKINAMDKISEKSDGPSIDEIKKKLTRSAKLAELRASLCRFQGGANKLKEIEKKTSIIEQSPKLKNFKTIELEVHTSPQKIFSPEKAYLSPKKDPSVRKNLIHLLSPTKNAVALPSISKAVLEEAPKAGLTLPVKYRYFAEMFRCIDTIIQILYNRKETITFRKLKPAVEEMIKRNLLERHLAQILKVYPEAFRFRQEKLRCFGDSVRQEQWELVITPTILQDHITSEVLLERRRKLFNILLDKVKDYHSEFLMSLEPPMVIDKDKISRWHPDFDIEKLPDIECAELPKPPVEEKFTSGKDVLEKARQMFNCNTRMEQALIRLKEARENNVCVVEEKPKEMPISALKGIPKALLEKVRQKQAAKALVSMTRSADKEKEVQLYSRLPELARLTRNLFVSEKKSVLPLDVVVEKLGNCYRTNLSKTEMEDHLKVITKEISGWLVLHKIRNTEYLKIAKNADISLVLNKLDNLAKQKREA